MLYITYYCYLTSLRQTLVYRRGEVPLPVSDVFLEVTALDDHMKHIITLKTMTDFSGFESLCTTTQNI